MIRLHGGPTRSSRADRSTPCPRTVTPGLGATLRHNGATPAPDHRLCPTSGSSCAFYDGRVADVDEISDLINSFYQRGPCRFIEETGELVPTLEQFPPLPRTADFSFIGTDESEFVISLRDYQELSREQVGQMRSRYCLLPGNCQIVVNDTIAWAIDQPTLVREFRPRIPLRLTAILRLEGGEWRLAHMHLSAGARNEELWGHRLTTSIEDLADRAASEALRTSRDSTGEILTIVFTDITSSTDYMVRIGDEDWLELVRWHNWRVRELVVAHGGSEVKSQGDGFMLVFDEVEAAFDCMLELLSAFAIREHRWDPNALGVRIGAHTGPTSRDLGDHYGTAVVTAARIGASAEGGEALVSEVSAGASSGYLFGQPKNLRLKGLPGMHMVLPLLGRAPRLNG